MAARSLTVSAAVSDPGYSAAAFSVSALSFRHASTVRLRRQIRESWRLTCPLRDGLLLASAKCARQGDKPMPADEA
jgi:hypothetical protein